MKWSYDLNSNSQNNIWTLKNCPLRFVTVDNREKTGKKFFFTGKIAFYFKILFYSNLLGRKETVS